MSRRHQTIHIGLQSTEDSIDIPPLLPSRQKTSRRTLYSRSHCSQPCSLPETPSSPNLSQAASRLELICTTETCNNSKSCTRTFYSDYYPEDSKGGKKESGQCSESCQNMQNTRISRDLICTKETCNNSQSCIRTYQEGLDGVINESRWCSKSSQNMKASNARPGTTYGSSCGHVTRPSIPSTDGAICATCCSNATRKSRPSSEGTTCHASCGHTNRGSRPSSSSKTCDATCTHGTRESRSNRNSRTYSVPCDHGTRESRSNRNSRTHSVPCDHGTRELNPSNDYGGCPPAIPITTVRQSESLLRMMSNCCESNRSQNSRSEFPIKSLNNQPTHKQFKRTSSEMETSCYAPKTTNSIGKYHPEQRVNNAYTDMPCVEKSCCKVHDPIHSGSVGSNTHSVCCLNDAGTQSVPDTKTTSNCAISTTKQPVKNKYMPAIGESRKSPCMISSGPKERTGSDFSAPPKLCQDSKGKSELAFIAPVKGDSILDNTQLRNELLMKLKKVCCEENMKSLKSCKKDSHVKKGLSEEDLKLLRGREDMKLGNSQSNENVKEKKSPWLCPETEVPQEVQKKCSCHFPPAFNQFGCSGNISGNCNCASGD